ncbi:GNAT family N-acetyltransferase [Mastigocladopsis repens]|uniref:GNAT family N-acetyltransferase n=1 Tax=Mastigocladopsis repens TaxID=221287 RepID=UPI00036C044E|nr:GNAT family N-acetyltransferase [Mastigocladopsis repens]
MEPAIHRVNAPDVPSLHQIILACGFDLKNRFGLHHWLSPIYPLEQMLQDADKHEVYALTVGENLVGTFTLEMTAEVPLTYIKYGKIIWQVLNVPAVYVYKLAILPTWQGQGLGMWCMEVIERLATEQGYHAVRLDAVKTHHQLLSFYQNRGYRRVGELIFNSDVWIDSIVFEKVLVRDGE